MEKAELSRRARPHAEMSEVNVTTVGEVPQHGCMRPSSANAWFSSPARPHVSMTTLNATAVGAGQLTSPLCHSAIIWSSAATAGCDAPRRRYFMSRRCHPACERGAETCRAMGEL